MKNNRLKILAIAIPVLVIGVIAYLFFNLQQKKERVKILETIPEFNLKTIDGSLLTSENLKNTTKVIVYFSPDCHFCQGEAEELYENINKYNDIQWVWVASEPANEIKKFAEKYHLDKNDNIHWCYDDNASFYRKYQMKSVPYFLVYDENNKLIKRNSGAIKLEKLFENSNEKN